jgi:hypothetical protein
VSVTAALSILINLPALSITTSSLPPGMVGIAYSQALGASGGEPPYTWSLTSGSLPVGLNLAANGTISGTPGAAGSGSFTVRASDRGANSTTAVLSVTINPPGLTITTSSLPAGRWERRIHRCSPRRGAATIRVVDGGSLPAGLSLAAVGTISARPHTTEQFHAG